MSKTALLPLTSLRSFAAGGVLIYHLGGMFSWYNLPVFASAHSRGVLSAILSMRAFVVAGEISFSTYIRSFFGWPRCMASINALAPL